MLMVLSIDGHDLTIVKPPRPKGRGQGEHADQKYDLLDLTLGKYDIYLLIDVVNGVDTGKNLVSDFIFSSHPLL